MNINEKITALGRKIRTLQAQLDTEIAQRNAELHVNYEKGKAVFEEAILRRHRELKVGLWAYLKNARPLVVLTAPIIYSLLPIFILLDLFVSLYQWICFPIYGIEKVRRGEYLIFDRMGLPYLNIVQKVNCAYCSYCNGIAAYSREVAGRTERYWCPVKHAKRMVSGYHEHYDDFADFGDIEAFQKLYSRDEA